MKKFLVSVLILFPQVLWAGSCNKIAAPNLSDPGWSIFDQYAYEDERLGVSVTYDNEGDTLTYYTFDLGLEVIDGAVVEE